MSQAILLISSPDQKGITAAVTNFIFENDGNIIHADQHIDDQENIFFMRVVWSLDQFMIERDQIANRFAPISTNFDMQADLYFSDEKPKMALFVSKPLHCLYDLLYRQHSGQLNCDIPFIYSNHEKARSIAEDFGIPYFYEEVTPENKQQAEENQQKLIEEHKADFVVLARYHQILSKSFVEKYPQRIINIHHSFLPAFAGKNPYAQAYEKGVKIIGATSHYVIEELDQGPIIEQDTDRISHRHSVEDLRRKGEDLEKIVLSRAVRLHLERKILCYNNKTVIFD